MQAALALAARGLGTVAPNPAVGCVIVAAGRTVGRGHTQPGGRPHAEAVALSEAGVLARGATAYVTLEPCSHHGRTPPCADALVDAGVSRVVVAIEDPDDRVSGRGLQRLRDAGITVETGLMAAEAERLNEGFLKTRRQGLPMVTLKLALSLDGRIATANGRSKWITGPAARRHVHLMRAEHDAIAVGIGTALADDPELTCRLPGLEGRSPRRVVFDSALRLPPGSRLADISDAGTTLLALETADPARRAALEGAGVEVVRVPADAGGGLDPRAALRLLAEAGVTRLMVEGGGRLAASLMAADLVHRLAIFTAPVVLGGDGYPAIGALGLDDPGHGARFTAEGSVQIGADRLDLYHR
jgi:diaminohydroxyphosphoribosylaminopyrimidine deaminase/5-amino-6-(5-phosphoribosylamino)uracil reductase